MLYVLVIAVSPILSSVLPPSLNCTQLPLLFCLVMHLLEANVIDWRLKNSYINPDHSTLLYFLHTKRSRIRIGKLYPGFSSAGFVLLFFSRIYFVQSFVSPSTSVIILLAYFIDIANGARSHTIIHQ